MFISFLVYFLRVGGEASDMDTWTTDRQTDSRQTNPSLTLDGKTYVAGLFCKDEGRILCGILVPWRSYLVGARRLSSRRFGDVSRRVFAGVGAFF